MKNDHIIDTLFDTPLASHTKKDIYIPTPKVWNYGNTHVYFSVYYRE